MPWTSLLWNIAYAIIILIAGNVFGSWLRGLLATRLERTTLDPTVRRLVVSLVRPLVIVIAVVAALKQLSIPISTFAAIVGASTLAVGMALRGSLSNIASGALLLTFRPFNVGDTVTVGGVTGTVHALQLFTTILHTSDGQTVTLANDAVWASTITNYSDRPTRRIRLVFTVPPDADLERVEACLRGVIEGHEAVLDDPEPQVGYDQATDLGLPVLLTVHVVNADYWSARSALQKAAALALAEAGIVLATRAR